MIGIDVGDHRDQRIQAQEAAVAFVGFGHQPLAAAQARIGAGGEQLAADDEGRIDAALAQHARGQRRGGGLAVRAGHGDAAAEAHQLGQHLGARHDRDALRARFHQFGVVVLDRAGHDHAIGAQHVGRGMAAMHGGAQLGQAARDRVVGVIRTRHLVAERAQHLRYTAHADAADADEMHAAIGRGEIAAVLHAPCVHGARHHARLLQDDVGDASGGIGLGQRARGLRHRIGAANRQRARARSASTQPRFEAFAFGDQHGGAVLDQEFGVARLVVVDRSRERHQHRAEPAAHNSASVNAPARHTTRSAQRVGRGHVGDERFDAGQHARFGIGLLRRFAASSRRIGGGLPMRPCRSYAKPSAARRSRRARPGCRRAPACARGRRDRRTVRAGGAIAAISARTGLPTTLLAGEAAGETGQHALGESGEHAVGHPGRAILFVHDQRNAGQPRCNPARTRRIAAETDHRTRLTLAQRLARSEHGATAA